MHDTAMLSARIDVLEMSRAHQERAIEELSEALAAQWKLVDALKGEVARLSEQMRDAASQAPGESEPPPPHY